MITKGPRVPEGCTERHFGMYRDAAVSSQGKGLSIHSSQAQNTRGPFYLGSKKAKRSSTPTKGLRLATKGLRVAGGCTEKPFGNKS